ncbi:helix-turn-helix domain-containing protein [Pelagibius sp. Alg239-R121]|uniref:helix-turn-helix domain-containing protein n=1 Tax=Pelagibius sp. Alg239-R121 TaxID=2993448 RepID=UPI0024A62913|nr:helix-turn-helix domain-containing protein [Pelagibius sp. Alg239-R121]
MTNRIKELRRRQGLTQDGLGKLVGTGRSQIVKLERGERRLTVEWMRRLARALECHPAELIDTDVGTEDFDDTGDSVSASTGYPNQVENRISRQRYDALASGFDAPESDFAPRSGEAAPASVAVPATANLLRDVEVRGVAVGGNESCFEFNGEVVDRVRRPPGIAGASNVFAIYVVGQSMSPRFEEGEIVFVHPGRPATSGCDVIVELHGHDGDPGQCYIKRLVKKTPTRTVLQQFNPARDDIAFDNDNIRAMYRILTASELLGV